MALLKEHEKYHTLSPVDVGMSTDKRQVATIDVARTTNHTGEQFHVAVPVYADDTREALNDRLQFFLSIIQDRLEEENKAVVAQNEKAQKIRNLQESMRRNGIHFKKKLEALKKRARKEKWEDAEFVAERAKLIDELKNANEQLASAFTEDEKKGIDFEVPEEASELSVVPPEQEEQPQVQ